VGYPVSVSIIYQVRKRRLSANISTACEKDPYCLLDGNSEVTTKGNSIGKKKLPVNIERDQRSNMEVDCSTADIFREMGR